MDTREAEPRRRGVKLAVALAAGLGIAAAAAWLVPLPVEPAAVAAPAPAPVAEKLTPTEPPVPVPAYDIAKLDGTPASTADFRDKLTVLNLWATWCAPCVRELPALAALQREMGGEDFQVVALSIDRGAAYAVKPFLERAGITDLPIYLDPKGVSMKELGLRGLPTTLLIDGQGREVARLEGDAAWDAEATKAVMREWLGRATP